MIKVIEQNLLTADVDAIVHQANCFHCMGGGIAAAIKSKFPAMFDADCETPLGDERKLGTFSVAYIQDGRYGYNLYSQYTFTGATRHTRYDAMVDGLNAIKRHAIKYGLKTIGIPKYMGCGLGGGDWDIVMAILSSIFSGNEIDLLVCDYTP